MEAWFTISQRWPDQIPEIRRRCRVDPEFKATVADYAEARSALDRWRGIDPATSERIADYERLVHEIGGEIDQYLSLP